MHGTMDVKNFTVVKNNQQWKLINCAESWISVAKGMTNIWENTLHRVKHINIIKYDKVLASDSLKTNRATVG